MLAALSFVAIAFLAVPFPIVILLAGVAGWLLGRVGGCPARASRRGRRRTAPARQRRALHDGRLVRRTLFVAAVGVVLWLRPSRRGLRVLGRDSVLVDMGAVLRRHRGHHVRWRLRRAGLRGEPAVNVFGWLAPGEMVRGLALAETTPGPLIMVVQFVAFVGAYRDPGSLEPWVAAVLASALVVWVTFVPCFLLVMLGAPYVEGLRHNRALTSALTGITASVVGVIASLALYFAIHTLFDETREVDAGPVHVTRRCGRPSTGGRWHDCRRGGTGVLAWLVAIAHARRLAVLGLAVQLHCGD